MVPWGPGVAGAVPAAWPGHVPAAARGRRPPYPHPHPRLRQLRTQLGGVMFGKYEVTQLKKKKIKIPKSLLSVEAFQFHAPGHFSARCHFSLQRLFLKAK